MSMRVFRSIISLALMAGIGYSQCTGGLFALPMALAADTHLQQEIVQEDGSLMSKDITVCFDDLMSHALEEDHQEGDHIEQNHESDCGDGAPCVRQTQQVLTVTQSTSLAEDDDTIAIQDILVTAVDAVAVEEAIPRARAGPLYVFAKEAAHVLVKKE